ncbi:MAG: hypothetical protein J0M33_11585 [Anaerolineae bacterium]|nr:hypothetical protein [Anaerolineae bacterium]
MSKLRVLGLMALFILLAFSSTLVEARWVRMGDSSSAVTISPFCREGVTGLLAYTRYDAQDNPVRLGGEPEPFPIPEISIYAVKSLTYLGRTAEVGTDFSFFNDGINDIRIMNVDIPLSFHSERIFLGETAGLTAVIFNTPTGVQYARNYANWYGSTTQAWTTVPNFADYPYLIADSSNGIIRISQGFEACSNPTRIRSLVDGRLNQFDYDAPIAAYCYRDVIAVTGIVPRQSRFLAFDGWQFPVMLIRQQTIDRLGTPTQEVLLRRTRFWSGQISLYLLPTGQIDVRAIGLPPRPQEEYRFPWPGCQH